MNPVPPVTSTSLAMTNSQIFRIASVSLQLYTYNVKKSTRVKGETGAIGTRSPKAEKTRLAILASARRAFAEFGYDGAGVRAIASGAGVTAMMVNRYFGSKEGLFGDVVTDS